MTRRRSIPGHLTAGLNQGGEVGTSAAMKAAKSCGDPIFASAPNLNHSAVE
jgi:hypothetical protein